MAARPDGQQGQHAPEQRDSAGPHDDDVMHGCVSLSGRRSKWGWWSSSCANAMGRPVVCCGCVFRVVMMIGMGAPGQSRN